MAVAVKLAVPACAVVQRLWLPEQLERTHGEAVACGRRGQFQSPLE